MRNLQVKPMDGDCTLSRKYQMKCTVLLKETRGIFRQYQPSKVIFFKLYKWYQVAQITTIIPRNYKVNSSFQKTDALIFHKMLNSLQTEAKIYDHLSHRMSETEINTIKS